MVSNNETIQQQAVTFVESSLSKSLRQRGRHFGLPVEVLLDACEAIAHTLTEYGIDSQEVFIAIMTAAGHDDCLDREKYRIVCCALCKMYLAHAAADGFEPSHLQSEGIPLDLAAQVVNGEVLAPI
jgi:hypothetical protein